MCLISEKFNMFYDKDEDDFIGIGYKSVTDFFEIYISNNIDETGKLNWIKATGNFENDITYSSIKCEDAKYSYWPGFHIFLNIKDAINYDRFGTLIEVKYKNITGFGKNQTNYEGTGDCVIARYMKVSKRLSNYAYLYDKDVKCPLYREYY